MICPRRKDKIVQYVLLETCLFVLFLRYSLLFYTILLVK